MKDYKKIKPCIKVNKKMKFDETEIEEYEFHQYKTPTSINDTDINKIVVYNKLPFGKQDFRYFTDYKDAKKLYFHEYSVQKRVHIDDILIKLNTCIFWKHMRISSINTIKCGEKFAILSKKI